MELAKNEVKQHEAKQWNRMEDNEDGPGLNRNTKEAQSKSKNQALQKQRDPRNIDWKQGVHLLTSEMRESGQGRRQEEDMGGNTKEEAGLVQWLTSKQQQNHMAGVNDEKTGKKNSNPNFTKAKKQEKTERLFQMDLRVCVYNNNAFYL